MGLKRVASGNQKRVSVQVLNASGLVPLFKFLTHIYLNCCTSSPIKYWNEQNMNFIRFLCLFSTKASAVYTSKVKSKVHSCMGTEALYRPYGP